MHVFAAGSCHLLSECVHQRQACSWCTTKHHQQHTVGPWRNSSEWAIMFQVDLLLFYTPLGFGKLGEAWSRFSLIQAVG